jgi:hypothetical protein
MTLQGKKRALWRLGALALGAILVVGLAGCGKPKRAQVTGVVKLKGGKPVTSGQVNFWANEKLVGTGQIGPDGTYTVTDAPVGEDKVTVVTPKPRMGMAGMPGRGSEAPKGLGAMPQDKVPEGMKGDPLKAQDVVPVNTKYHEYGTTPLSHTVVDSKEPQKFDILDLDP